MDELVEYVFFAHGRPLSLVGPSAATPGGPPASGRMTGLPAIGTVIGSRHLPFTLMCMCIRMMMPRSEYAASLPTPTS